MAPPESGQKNKMSNIRSIGDEENSDLENEIDYDLIINSNLDVGDNDEGNESSSDDGENGEGFAYEALSSNPNTNEASEIFDENGQVVYKQLANGEEQTSGGESADNQDNALFDEFQLFAESRFNKKVKSSVLPIPSSTDDNDSDHTFKKLESENIKIDKEKLNEINKIMVNIKLDERAIPEWAKVVPEKVWKTNLIEKLTAKKNDLFDEQK